MRPQSKLTLIALLGLAALVGTSVWVVSKKGASQLGGVFSFYGTLVLLYPAVRQSLESRLFTRALNAPSDDEFAEVDADIAQVQQETHPQFEPSEYLALVAGALLVCVGFALTVLLSPDIPAPSSTAPK